MFSVTNLRRHALTGAVALLIPAGALVGLGAAGAASAQAAPTYVPLFNAATNMAQGGDLTVTPGATSSSVTIYLENVEAGVTYTVTNCSFSPATAVESCAAGTPATMTTDATGNGTATFTFPTTTVGTISVVDPLLPGDSYYATVSGATTLPLLGTVPSGLPMFNSPSPILPSPD